MSGPNSPDLNPLDYYVWGVMLKSTCTINTNAKTTDELKVAMQTIWEELPQEHINNAVANFTKRLAAAANGGHLSIYSNFICLQVCILISSPTNRLFSELLRLTGKMTLGTHTKNGVLSWMKQHNFVIFRYISTKLADKVYVLLFNSCIKFHTELFTHC